MKTYFVIISGEDINLARAEIDSLIGLTGFDARVIWLGHLALIESIHDPTDFLLERAAMIREAGVVIGQGPLSDSSIDWLSDDMLKACVKPSQTFSVKTKSLAKERYVNQRESLSVSLGERIGNLTKARVSLDTPDIRMLLIMGPDRTLVCVSKESRLRQELRLREPGRKPFFHPSMMNSQLARVICNLAGVKPDTTVLDPFCGGGGILCEAAILGARVLGWDLNWRLLMGAMENLEGRLERDASLIQADSRWPPLKAKQFDCIVTDPPYGRTSSTRGAKAMELIRTFLEQIPEIIREGGRLCICGSHELGIKEMMQDLGFSLKYHVLVPVHSGLTREVIMAQF